MAINHRKHKRFSATAFLSTPCTLKPISPFIGHPVKGQMIDLSAGGMALLMKELIPQDTRLHLELVFPDGTKLNSDVKVVHARPRNGKYVHGFEFLTIPSYMADKINHMSEDYIDCENRIRNHEKEICKSTCKFFTMCTKKERRDPVFNVDVALEIAFKALDDSPLHR